MILREITRAPHPVGTEEHQRVRGLLLEELERLGLEPEVQRTTGVRGGGGPTVASTVFNIVARRPGTRSTGALLLMAHYDSGPVSKGAGDDGAGVVAILETLRALRTVPLRNDLIVLISDAEEQGLLGAEAFVREHPWADDVRLVLNLEARGAGGPAYLFETSPGNGELIREVAAAAPHPVATSLAYEVYRRMPNDTDLSIFLRRADPIPGLNFAFVEDQTRYHSPRDDFDGLSQSSLQHHGSWLLSLARRFGDVDLRSLQGENRVYFSAPGGVLLHYPESWALVIAAFGVLAVLALIAWGVRRKQLTARGVGRGTAAFLAALLCGPLAAYLGWLGVVAMHPTYAQLREIGLYNPEPYTAAFTALAAVMFLVVYAVMARSVKPPDLTVAPLVVYSLLGLFASIAAPGASYLFAWPLLAGVAASALLFHTRPTSGSVLRLAGFASLAVPALLLIPPLVPMLVITLGPSALPICAVLTVLTLGILLPQLAGVPALPVRGVAVALVVVVAGALVVGARSSGFGAERPRPDSVFYVLQADAGRAYWASYDQALSPYTEQFFGAQSQRGPIPGRHAASAPALYDQAPALPLPPPAVQVLQEESTPDGRRVRLRVTSARGAERLVLFAEGVWIESVNGVPPSIDSRAPAAGAPLLVLNAPTADGFEVELGIGGSAPVELLALDVRYGFPHALATGVRPRTAAQMKHPFHPTDLTQVQRTFRI